MDRPEAKEKEGRLAAVTELSARDLSCSDQLKADWSGREENMSEGALVLDMLLACDRVEDAAVLLPDRRRAEFRAAPMKELPVVPEAPSTPPVGGWCMLLSLVMAGVFGGMEGTLLPGPGLAPPFR